MRHVASKIPSIGPDGEEIARDPVAEEHEKEAKRHRRAAKKEAHDEEAVDDGIGLNSNEEERLEQLYEKIAWPLGKKYGHPYDAFKLALTCEFLISYHCFRAKFFFFFVHSRSVASKKPCSPP